MCWPASFWLHAGKAHRQPVLQLSRNDVAMHASTALMKIFEVENKEYGVRTHILSPGVALTVDRDSEGRP